MEKRIYNFSAGPAILPEEVLLEAQKDLFTLPGVGMSILEISHRSKTYDAIHAEAKEGLKKLLDIPDDYQILFLQGGASLQFSMVPLNLMPPKNKADYISTGSWSKKGIKEAKRVLKKGGILIILEPKTDLGFISGRLIEKSQILDLIKKGNLNLLAEKEFSDNYYLLVIKNE